jgi:hypothetical protein
MALLTGIAFFVFWLLIDVFTLTVVKAALVTALIFILIGILVEGYPFVRKVR